jgi:hypothetical protein
VYEPGGEAKDVSGATIRTIRLETDEEGRTVALDEDGNDLGDRWKEPGTLAVVGEQGYIDFAAEKFYDDGVQLFIDAKGETTVANGEPHRVKTTEAVRMKWSRPWTKLSSFVGTDKLTPQLPEAYEADSHLILLGDSGDGELVAALQASELLPQVVDERYPGPGKALVTFARSPFELGKNVILIGGSDNAGLSAGIRRLETLLPPS